MSKRKIYVILGGEKMREIYHVEIKVENEKSIELVKKMAIYYAIHADDDVFGDIADGDTVENVKKRYVANNLTESESSKLDELCEDRFGHILRAEITKNTISLYLLLDEPICGNAGLWCYFLIWMAQNLPSINFELEVEARNDSYNAFSCGKGIAKNGVICQYVTEFFEDSTVELNGKVYDCSKCYSPDDYPEFFEAGKIIDGKYVSFENVNITNLKDVAICFTESEFLGEEEFFTKIILRNGGFVRNAVSGKTNYLIYNPKCGYETSKLRQAKELNDVGKNIEIVTVSEFCENLCLSDKSDNDKKTIDEWMKIFELKNFRKGYAIAKYKGNQTNVTIPAMIDDIPVLKIGTEAFQNCKKVKSIDIPDSIVEIGNCAFEKCISLENINLSSKIRIGDGAFSGCTKFADENGFVIIRNVLHSCKTEKEAITIPSNITSICTDAFSECVNLTSIVIPDGMTKIGGLSRCRKLKTISIPNSVTEIKEQAFRGCISLKDIILPNSVTKIGRESFRGCVDLENISIPNNVAEIGSGAFFQCKSLKSISIPDKVTEIDGTFFECEKLTSVTFPGYMEDIGFYTFCGCFHLKSINIPSGVTQIKAGVFSWCKSLTSLTIPDTVTEIDSSAFKSCIEFPTIITPKGSYAAKYFKTLGTELGKDFTITEI